jgi:1-acyl-sn-glycerol-3-phosphate acyltransferase
VDLVTDRQRMPRLRLLSFALAWSALEAAGMAASTALWATGQGNDVDAHYALQRWWATQLIEALRHSAGLRFEVHGLEDLTPGPTILCARHASIVDALLPAWLLGRVGMRPRYVLKDDLQLDPCLDIVGHRLPNHFLDRDPQDSRHELEELERLAGGMTSRDAVVIFPEGTVVTDSRRARAIARVAANDPDRAARVRGLRTLGPVRPAGTQALLRGAPDADLVLVVHAGLEPLQRLADAPARVPLDRPVRIDITRIPRAAIPEGEAFTAWFDTQWRERDRQLTRTLGD